MVDLALTAPCTPKLIAKIDTALQIAVVQMKCILMTMDIAIDVPKITSLTLPIEPASQE